MYGMMIPAGRPLPDKLTAEEVAAEKVLGPRSAWSIRQAWRRGEIPGVKIGGRLIFSRAELERWFAEQSRANLKGQAKAPLPGGARGDTSK